VTAACAGWKPSAGFGGTACAVTVWRFSDLAPDQRVEGPAIVESDTTTVLLLPGDSGRLDARGWLEVGVGR
jgi:N-methylhydantoinase A